MDLIKAVITTLESVEVKGAENWDKMLGCVNALKSYVAQVEAEKSAQPSASQLSKEE